MPVEVKEPSLITDRAKYTHLEAFGRLLCASLPGYRQNTSTTPKNNYSPGIFKLAMKGIENATNPAAKDYMNWGNEGGQPLVDASFFAYGLIRCPKLWEALDSKTRQNVITSLLKTRKIKPPENNWLLFAAMIEAFFITINEPSKWHGLTMPLNSTSYGIRRRYVWRWRRISLDYYNSFVIILTCTIS